MTSPLAPGVLDGPPDPVGTLALVVPADVAAPTGGNVYDRRLRQALLGRGTDVAWHPVAGDWPEPAAVDAAGLDALLRSLPDGTPVLLDGLVACGVPEVVLPHARRLRTAVLLHLPLALEHGLPAQRASRLDAAERRVLAAVDRVVVTSGWTARRLHGHELRAAPVVALPGTDARPAAHRGRSAGTRLLCVGSVTPRKQQRRLVAALADVPAPWELRLVGAHPDPVELNGLHRDLAGLTRAGGPGTVRVTGPLQGPALEEQWRWADLLVLPSLVETFGMVVTEALARGLPVLCTTGGALPETLGRSSSGPPGLLVPPGDTTGLTAALRTWLDDAALRVELARRARERAAELPGWDATAAVVAQALPAPGTAAA